MKINVSFEKFDTVGILFSMSKEASVNSVRCYFILILYATFYGKIFDVLEVCTHSFFSQNLIFSPFPVNGVCMCECVCVCA